MADHRAVGEPRRRQLVGARLSDQLRPRAPKPGERAAVAGYHLFVFDAGSVKRLLDPAAGMKPRAAVIPMADVERRGRIIQLWHVPLWERLQGK
jgi:hypothetical protein